MDPTPPGFVDVPMLLERSEPRRRGFPLMFWVGLFAALVMGSAWISNTAPHGAEIVKFLGGVGMLGVMISLMVRTRLLMRAHREEQRQVDAASELIQLRRWPDAALTLMGLLSRPPLTQHVRVQGLYFLSGVLSRYHRYTDAIAVQEYLLNHVLLDEGTLHSLKLGRAMAMLQEDHLFDADRAIAELRRGPGRHESAGLALIEIYRDVKTGHPTEAIELFNLRLPILREQLGHRVADAWALVARAYDLLDRHDEARAAFEKATLLAPVGELTRRYSEVAAMTPRYSPAPAPPEAA